MNVSLAEDTLGRIIAEPENWDQEVWVCGTTRCFAGHAAELAGGIVVQWDVAAYRSAMCLTPDGRLVAVSDYAAEVLELTPGQAFCLFAATNRLGDLQAWVKQFTEDQVTW